MSLSAAHRLTPSLDGFDPLSFLEEHRDVVDTPTWQLNLAHLQAARYYTTDRPRSGAVPTQTMARQQRGQQRDHLVEALNSSARFAASPRNAQSPRSTKWKHRHVQLKVSFALQIHDQRTLDELWKSADASLASSQQSVVQAVEEVVKKAISKEAKGGGSAAKWDAIGMVVDEGREDEFCDEIVLDLSNRLNTASAASGELDDLVRHECRSYLAHRAFTELLQQAKAEAAIAGGFGPAKQHPKMHQNLRDFVNVMIAYNYIFSEFVHSTKTYNPLESYSLVEVVQNVATSLRRPVEVTPQTVELALHFAHKAGEAVISPKTEEGEGGGKKTSVEIMFLANRRRFSVTGPAALAQPSGSRFLASICACFTYSGWLMRIDMMLTLIVAVVTVVSIVDVMPVRHHAVLRKALMLCAIQCLVALAYKKDTRYPRWLESPCVGCLLARPRSPLPPLSFPFLSSHTPPPLLPPLSLTHTLTDGTGA